MSDHPEDDRQVTLDRYQVLIEDMATGFYETNAKGELFFFNAAFCKIVGRSAEEITNRNLLDFMTPDEDLSTQSSDTGIDSNRRPTGPSIWRIKRQGRHQRILQVSLRPIMDSGGRILGSRGIVRDITAEMQNQAEVDRSTEQIEQLYAASMQAERRSRAFLDFLPIPLLVQNMDHSVAYLNPAYEETFGWTREDLELDPFAPIPADQIKKTRTGKASLLTNGVFYGLETKRLTKDGRVLDVIYDGSALYDQDDRPNGLITTMRDITQSQKDARITQALFKIAKALHRYSDLKSCLIFIARQAQQLMNVRNAYIILIDGGGDKIYSRTGMAGDCEFYDTFSEAHVSLNGDPAGKAVLAGSPYINNTINDEDEFNAWRLTSATDGFRNLIAAPMQVDKRIMGVMVMTNRVDGNFDQDDMTLLSSIASMVAMPVENASINESLRRSYEEVQILNQAKDRIIDRLSHELRTPVSVLAASFEMLAGNQCSDKQTTARLVTRCQRNIERIIDMQYKLEDIVSEPDQGAQQSFSALLALCIEELEALVGMETSSAVVRRIRRHIDSFFSLRTLPMARIRLHRFVADKIIELTPLFSHRRLDLQTSLEADVGFVNLPIEILYKIITGLVRNAVEYTPDGGMVKVLVRLGDAGPELIVSDTGIGITNENQQLIKGNFFTAADTYQYGTGNPFHFDAGGRGLDLLRMRVFSERYPIRIVLTSKRCRHIPTNADKCPGSTNKCNHCDSVDYCHRSGGTTFSIQFVGADIGNL